MREAVAAARLPAFGLPPAGPWRPAPAGVARPALTGAALGRPRVHLRRTGSTNAIACALAAHGAPHGTLVTAAEQLAGRGRQGRSWSAPPGSALLASWVIRDPPPLLSLAAGVAVAQVVERTLESPVERTSGRVVERTPGRGVERTLARSDGSGRTPSLAPPGADPRSCPRATLKWPNDVLLDARKLAGILVEARPRERWAVLGIGINVAVKLAQLPPELRQHAATLELTRADIEPLLGCLCTALPRLISMPADELLDEFRARDALVGRRVRWAGGAGTAAGVDQHGRLLVTAADGSRIRLDAGEVHLMPAEPMSLGSSARSWLGDAELFADRRYYA